MINKALNLEQEANMGKKNNQNFVQIPHFKLLFRSENGTILNSDVNGAHNIIRKAIPDAFAKGIEGVGLHPIRSNAL